MLLYQNKAMQIRLKEIKMEMQAQEETIKHLSEKQRLYDETLSCAHRTWGQVNYIYLNNENNIIIFFLCS